MYNSALDVTGRKFQLSQMNMKNSRPPNPFRFAVECWNHGGFQSTRKKSRYNLNFFLGKTPPVRSKPVFQNTIRPGWQIQFSDIRSPALQVENPAPNVRLWHTGLTRSPGRTRDQSTLEPYIVRTDRVRHSENSRQWHPFVSGALRQYSKAILSAETPKPLNRRS